MKNQQLHIVVVGNGAAGNSAASAIRRVNKGTSITMIAQEPHPQYSAGVLSKKYISGEMRKEEVFIKTFEDYSKENIDILLDQKVYQIDSGKKSVMLGNRSIRYDKLIIATGSRPVLPRIEGVDKKKVFTLKSLKDAEAIFNCPGEKVVVVGAGPIGVEASISLKKGGREVFLVELKEWVLPNAFDERPGEILRKTIESHNIEVLTGEKLIKIWGSGDIQGVSTDRREMKCDMVVLALGMVPETRLAQEGGIEIGALGGIKVNEEMMTSIEDVYACGDCVEAKDAITEEKILSPLWHNAIQQGDVAGCNAAGVKKHYDGSMNISCTDVFGVAAVSIGHTRDRFENDRLRVVERNNGYYHRLLIRDGIIVGAQFIGKIESVGILLNIMRKGYSLGRIQTILNDRSLLLRTPGYYRICSDMPE
jgi:NADH oxidase (H2O2-forming)